MLTLAAMLVAACGDDPPTKPAWEGRSCGGGPGQPLIDCPDLEAGFCDSEISSACNSKQGIGVCRVRPESCSSECVEVCGCDDRAFCNECAAHRAGVDVRGKRNPGTLNCPGLPPQ